MKAALPVVGLLGLAGCADVFSPSVRGGSGVRPRHGDYVARVDSVRVEPLVAREGDTVTVRLYATRRGACFPFTVIWTSPPHVVVTVWGWDRKPAADCVLLHESPRQVRFVMRTWGHADSVTVGVAQPDGTELRAVVMLDPSPRPAPPADTSKTGRP